MRKPSLAGFSLIEVLVTVAIVAILAAVAIPAYTSYVARGARANAKVALMENAQYMERRFTMRNCYQCAGEAIGAIAIPRGQSPDTGAAEYNISLVDGSTDDDEFLLQAAPTGRMASDDCGTFTIDQSGAKGVTGQPAGATITAQECWDK